jgi:hypothetical protein
MITINTWVTARSRETSKPEGAILSQEANTMGVVSVSREKCLAIVPKTTSHLAPEL